MKNPFQIAENYIQLRKKCAPPSWGDTILRVNEMIIVPLMSLFMLFMGMTDFLSLISVSMNAYHSWSDWINYNNLKHDVQMMFLHTMKVGGPFIKTNDTTYMPYVFADAVMRTSI